MTSQNNTLLEKNQSFQHYENNKLTTTSVVNDEISHSPNILAQHCHFIRIDTIGYDAKDKMPRREALQNVIGALNSPDYNFVYLLSGNEYGVELYLGVTKDYTYQKHSKFHAYDYGELLRESFKGNFHGSSVCDVTSESDLNREILSKIERCKRGSIITGIPSINEKHEGKDVYTQKLDRLVNSMGGATGHWQLMIVCDAMSHREINELKDALFDIYEQAHLAAKVSIQESTSENESSSVTLGTGSNKSESTGTNKSDSNSKNSEKSSSSHSTGINNNISTGSNKSESKGQSQGTSSSVSKSAEHIDKEYQALLQYMDDELFERVNQGLVKGLFKTSVYALAENNLTHQRLVRNLCSMWQGDSSSFSPLRTTELPDGVTCDLFKVLSHFQSLNTANTLGNELPLIFGHPNNKEALELRTCLTAHELSLICSLPAKELPGISLSPSVDFSLNPKATLDDDAITLGSLIHQGNVLAHRTLSIDKAMLSRHVFIGGVTGSGKTTTCRRLLTESQLPFLVIEPAKTEYRSLLGEIDDMAIYTLGNENIAPFRFNPFELLLGESITSHVDMLKAAFTAAFPMEAAMPYLLEEAIYECYSDYGWNTDGWMVPEQANRYHSDPWNCCGLYWPTMDDLLANMDKVVKSKNFDQRLESDYIASLVARFKNLTVGAKGKMLNCKVSTNLTSFLDKKVILELDELKSPEDKCLMMGLVISRLAEAIKLRFMEQPDYKHITLMEEAHRLLEKVSPGDDSSRGHSVGMFTDLLAEVRKYGESLIIVDQIPNKLTPEVLKNTNIKVIHKLFARDDREVIGDTVGLDDQQKTFLTKLKIGETIVYSGDWNEAVHVKINRMSSDTSLSELELMQLAQTVGKRQQHSPDALNAHPEFADVGGDELADLDVVAYGALKSRFKKVLESLADNAREKSLSELGAGASGCKSKLNRKAFRYFVEDLTVLEEFTIQSGINGKLLQRYLLSRLPLTTSFTDKQAYEAALDEWFKIHDIDEQQSLFNSHPQEIYFYLLNKIFSV